MHYSKVRIALQAFFITNIEQILVQWISGMQKYFEEVLQK